MRTVDAPPTPDIAVLRQSSPWWQRPATLIFGTLGGAWLLNGLTMRHYTKELAKLPEPVFPNNRWLDAWVKWDAGWYHTIVTQGYSYTPGKQSSIAFFPAYPLLMRWLGPLMGNDYLAGIAITVASGIGYLFLAWAWFRDRLGASAAWTALFLLCWYPFAFYLYGPVYSDAFFAVAALGAFVLLERDRTVLAGLAGACASAARPVGIAVVAGLVILALNRREFFQHTPRLHLAWPNLRWKDAGVLLSSLGVGAYLAYLFVRFGNPVAFLGAEAGWDQAPGWQTWLKAPLIRALAHGQQPTWLWRHGMHLIMGVLALALLPRVWKRFGSAYAVFAAIIIAIPMISTKDFFSTGRYLLPAFPCFAAAGEILAARRRTRIVVLAASLSLLISYVILFGRGNYVA